MYYIILLEFNSLKNLQLFYNLEFKNIKFILHNDIRINYRTSKIFKLSLFDSNNNYLASIDKINNNELKKILNIIVQKNKKNINNVNKLKKICQMPNNYSTIHCFLDGTHQTCCLLGYKARKYSNESGNPIGKASEEIFKKYFKRKPKKSDLTPWCTCIGSGVCSYYAENFDDNTHIKFINSKKDKFLVYHIENYCELKISKEFYYISHNTPGINTKKNNKNLKTKCPLKKLEYKKI